MDGPPTMLITFAPAAVAPATAVHAPTTACSYAQDRKRGMEEEAIAAAGEGTHHHRKERRTGWSCWPTWSGLPSESPTISISTSCSDLESSARSGSGDEARRAGMEYSGGEWWACVERRRGGGGGDGEGR